jgi:hypothetical protein
MGYALGAFIAGVTADVLGYAGAITVVAALTAASGLWVLVDMPAAGRKPDLRQTPNDASVSPPVPSGRARATAQH